MKLRLGHLLLKLGFITQEQLCEALAEQRRSGGKLGKTLLGLGHVKQFDLHLALAIQILLMSVAITGALLRQSASLISTDELRNVLSQTGPGIEHSDKADGPSEVAGFILSSEGNVFVIGADGARREIAVGSPILQDDSIMTGSSGSIEVELSDGSKLSAGKGSSVVIDRFVFKPSPEAAPRFFASTKALFRLIDGFFATRSEHDVANHNGVATIGVRG